MTPKDFPNVGAARRYLAEHLQREVAAVTGIDPPILWERADPHHWERPRRRPGFPVLVFAVGVYQVTVRLFPFDRNEDPPRFHATLDGNLSGTQIRARTMAAHAVVLQRVLDRLTKALQRRDLMAARIASCK